LFLFQLKSFFRRPEDIEVIELRKVIEGLKAKEKVEIEQYNSMIFYLLKNAYSLPDGLGRR
jgi:predicted mannosyl-3-phosphoglycerate phosphatase (HAD superfamily)